MKMTQYGGEALQEIQVFFEAHSEFINLPGEHKILLC
jgi:hypothetical protein